LKEEIDRRLPAFIADNPPGSIAEWTGPGGLREHRWLARQPEWGDTAAGSGYGSLHWKRNFEGMERETTT
jgi:hypothetical protein